MARQRATSSLWIARARDADGSERSSSSAHPRLTAVGRDERSTRSASSRSSPRSAASASPYPAATPIAGAPRTASVRIASATSAGVRQTSSTSSSGSRRWSRRTTASSSSRTICSGASSAMSGVRPRTRPKRTGSRALVPRGQVLRLLLGQLVDVDTHRGELETGDLVVDRLGHRVDLALELRGVLDRVLGREGLVREGHVHHLGGMALGGGQVDEPAVRDQVDAPPVVEPELLDELARLPRLLGQRAQAGDVDLDVEVPGIAE